MSETFRREIRSGMCRVTGRAFDSASREVRSRPECVRARLPGSGRNRSAWKIDRHPDGNETVCCDLRKIAGPAPETLPPPPTNGPTFPNRRIRCSFENLPGTSPVLEHNNRKESRAAAAAASIFHFLFSRNVIFLS